MKGDKIMFRPGLEKVEATSGNQILFNVQYQLSVGCKLTATVASDSEGRKIVKAGTPLYGDILNRDAILGISDASGAVAGILLHDTDVDVLVNNAQCLIFGFVNLNRLDSATSALITDAVKTALPMVKFLKD